MSCPRGHPCAHVAVSWVRLWDGLGRSGLLSVLGFPASVRDARLPSAMHVANIFCHCLTYLFLLFLVFPNERKYLLFMWPDLSSLSLVVIAF